jgi:uncharacterized protein YggE
MPAAAPKPTVTVLGEAVVRSEPDEAVLSLTLTVVKKAPGAALSDVAERGAALVTLLDGLGVAKADRSTTGITVEEEHEHTATGHRVVGHRATSQTSVRFADPDQVGKLASKATDELSARINGLRWLISVDNPVRLEAARQAAANAEQKARAYADGIGAGLGTLMRLSEPGTASDDFLQPRRMVRTGYSASLSVPVEAGEQAVTASIEATFALVPG